MPPKSERAAPANKKSLRKLVQNLFLKAQKTYSCMSVVRLLHIFVSHDICENIMH